MAVIEQVISDNYALYNGDSCEILPTIPSESVHMSLYSPPVLWTVQLLVI